MVNRKKQASALKYLVWKNRHHAPKLVLLVIFDTVQAFLGVQFAMATRRVIDSAQDGGVNALVAACVLLTSVVLGIMALYAVGQYLRGWLRATLDREWKLRLSAALLHGDYATVSAYHSGELINRMNSDVDAVNAGVISMLPSLAALLTRLVAATWLMASMEPLFTLLSFLCGMVLIGVTGFFRKKLKTMYKQLQETNGKVNGFVQEAIEKLLAVQAMGVEGEIEAREKKLLNSRWKQQLRQQRFSILGTAGMYLASYILEGAALVWCALRLMRGEITFGTLTAVVQLTGQLEGPLLSFSGFIPQYVAMIASAERLMELENIPSAIQAGQTVQIDGAEEIRLEHVSFSYQDTPVLEDASAILPMNGFTAVTGVSGSGKSTLLKLLLGVYRPQSGETLLKSGGKVIPLTAAVKGLFAYVPQGNLLFSGTLRENLLLTSPGATEQNMKAAAYASCMDDYLPQLEQGLDTMLGESGSGLSEGQAQRVSIARAVLSGAPVLLLDEATSALDAETEKRVLQRLSQLPGRVCIAITHRPAALEMAERQMIVANGKITVQQL